MAVASHTTEPAGPRAAHSGTHARREQPQLRAGFAAALCPRPQAPPYPPWRWPREGPSHQTPGWTRLLPRGTCAPPAHTCARTATASTCVWRGEEEEEEMWASEGRCATTQELHDCFRQARRSCLWQECICRSAPSFSHGKACTPALLVVLQRRDARHGHLCSVFIGDGLIIQRVLRSLRHRERGCTLPLCE